MKDMETQEKPKSFLDALWEIPMNRHLSFLNNYLLIIIKYEQEKIHLIGIHEKLKKIIKIIKSDNKNDIKFVVTNPPYYGLMEKDEIIISDFIDYHEINGLKEEIKPQLRNEKIEKLKDGEV